MVWLKRCRRRCGQDGEHPLAEQVPETWSTGRRSVGGRGRGGERRRWGWGFRWRRRRRERRRKIGRWRRRFEVFFHRLHAVAAPVGEFASACALRTYGRVGKIGVQAVHLDLPFVRMTQYEALARVYPPGNRSDPQVLAD